MPILRNIAIIAHVDHGKTTLVDALLKFCQVGLDKNQSSDLIMDSNELERERGITIFSKNASVRFKDIKINIIDTPGHADFGGEVERVLKMADGALLLVDAQEGPMPQTRFVLKKALELGYPIIVVINKIDKANANCQQALEKTFELFIELGANDDQINFPVVYASAKQGLAGKESNLGAMKDIEPIFDAILEHVPEPTGSLEKPLQILITALAYDNYKGRLGIGRIYNGSIANSSQVAQINRDGDIKNAKISSLMTFEGLGKLESEKVEVGDIVAIAGIADINIGDTIADLTNPVKFADIVIEKPTVKMTFSVNDSPFAGNEGQYCTSRNLKERLYKELETDVALKIEDGQKTDEFIVSGRGELHLAILIERMRREGFELQVSKPEVILTTDSDGQVLEPIEDVWLEVPEVYMGAVIEKMGKRKGEMKNMKVENGLAKFHFMIPTRGLIGFRNEFMTDTRGTGIINSLYAGNAPFMGEVATNSHGSLIAFESGESNTYGMLNAQGRGLLFLKPGEKIYEGQIIGKNAKDEDIEVNICKTKKLSNMRSKGDGVSEILNAPKIMGLEDALEFIGSDELVEVTPQSVRLRKKILSTVLRQKARRDNKKIE